MSRLHKRYKEVVKKELQNKFKYSNLMLIPQLKKIIISMGIAEASKDKNAMQACVKEMALLSGQKPILTKSRRAIANFKLREKQPIGIKVTLRKKRMYDFLDRFCHIVSPRIRDFRGVSPKSFDGSGNFTMGIKEHYIFPEINYDKVEHLLGMDVCINTSAKTDKEARLLLGKFGMPFRQ